MLVGTEQILNIWEKVSEHKEVRAVFLQPFEI